MAAPDSVVNLAEKLTTFDDRWSPRIVAQLNDLHVKVAKVEGEFVCHQHPDTDELFLVVHGTLRIEMPERTVTLGAGELYVVPMGVEHRPVADGECHIVLVEPTGVPNTGTAAARPDGTAGVTGEWI